jgi:hypothetical protein
MSQPRQLQLTMGLRNAASGKYLTQETFGFAINCNGKQALHTSSTNLPRKSFV